jgi:hypothetical protein
MSRATRTKARDAAPDLLGDVATDPPKTDSATPENKPAKKEPSPPNQGSAGKREPKQHVVTVTADKNLPEPTANNLLSSLLSAIVDPRVDPAKVKTLTEVRKELMNEQAHVEFFEAYVAMKASLPVIRRDGKLDQGTTKSGRQGVTARYATYENIMDSVAPKLREHGFSMIVLPDAGQDGTGIVVRGSLSFVAQTQYGKHVYTERCAFPVPNDPTGGKSPPQGVGSAVKYGMRYAAIALLGIVSHAPEDADNHDGKKQTRKPADGEQISETEIYKLRKAIEFCGATDEEFCTFYKLEKIDDLPAKMLPEAMDACRRRAEGNEKEAKGGK